MLGFAIGQRVVPNADAVRAGRGQIRDLEVGARASHAAEHNRDTLTDHGAGRVDGLGKDAHVLCVLALVVIDMTGDSSGTVLSLISSPVNSKVFLPAGHQRSSWYGRR